MPPTLRPRKGKAVAAESDGEPEEPVPQRPARGRRATPRAGSNKPAGKRPRKAKKGLQNMLEMPLDIVYEILAYLNPADLVHLRKVSGVFYKFLSSPGAAPCWAVARANWEADEGELPARPEDMSEVDFLEYLFGKYCQGCSKSMSSVSICWEIRRRYCTACRDKTIASWKPQTQYDGRITEFLPQDFRRRQDFYERIAVIQIRQILPVVSKDPLPVRKVLQSTLPYLEEDLEGFKRKIIELSPDELFDYIRQRRDDLEMRREHEIPELSSWFTSKRRERAAELKTKKDDRFENIVGKLEALGWGEEFRLMDATWLARFKSLPAVKQPKPLTDRMWKNAQPVLIEFLEEAKAARIQEHRRQIVVSRFETFIRVIPKMQPYRPGAPSPIDIAMGFPKVREIIDQPNEVEVNEDSFDVLRDLLPGFVAQWQQDVRRFFSDLVRSSFKLPDNVDPLSLAVGTYFTCECGQTRSSFTVAAWHKCATSARQFTAQETEEDLFVIWAASTRLKWSRFWQPRGFAVAPRAKELMKLFGKDPARTTAADMDECPSRLACKTCDMRMQPKDSVNVFTWRYAMDNHKSADCQLYVVADTQAAVVKPLEAIAVARREQRWVLGLSRGFPTGAEYVSMECAHCDLRPHPIYHSFDEAIDHVKYTHDIANPKRGEDIWASEEAKLDERLFQLNFAVKLLSLASRDSKHDAAYYEWHQKNGEAILYDFDNECPADLSSLL